MGASELTDAELRAELKRRADIVEQGKLQERKEQVAKVLEHRDVLLKFMKHSKTTCSVGYRNVLYDERYGTAYCNKCALEALNEWDVDVEINTGVQMTRKGV